MNIINQIATVLNTILPYFIVGLLITAGSIVVTCAIMKIAIRHHYKKEPRYYFEVIPPASSAIEAEATTELLKVLHGIDRTRSFFDRMTGRRLRISLEIIATKNEGIRYIIGAPVASAHIVEQEVHSYVTDAKTSLVEDPYLRHTNNRYAVITEFKQKRHFALPLTPKSRLQQHDPLAYLTGNMTSLKDDETIIYQLVIIPRRVAEADYIASRVLTNEAVLTQLMHGRRSPFQGAATSLNRFLFSILDSIGGITAQVSSSHLSPSRSNDPLATHTRQVAMQLKPARVLSSFEQEAVESIHTKVSEPLFQASIRTLVIATSKAEANRRSQSIRASLTSFSTTQYQSIASRLDILKLINKKYRTGLQRYRLPTILLRSSLLLSTSEVGALFHFPYAGTNKTENIVKSLSRALPAPLSLKNNPVLDVLIGENRYHGQTTPIGLTEK